jgi:hypothetical protein
VVRLETGGQEVLARAGNFMVARAAFDTSVSLWPVAEIELRQGARVILTTEPCRSRSACAVVVFSVHRETLVSKDEIAQMAAQMLAEMPNASQQVAVALERELRERALESISPTPRVIRMARKASTVRG